MRMNDSSLRSKKIKTFTALMATALVLANPLAGSASETLLSRYNTYLSTSNAASLHVNPDSAVTLGSPKFMIWGASNNAALTQPELTLFALDRFGTPTSIRRFVNVSGGQDCKASRIIKLRDNGYVMIGHCTMPYYALGDISSVVFKVDANLNPIWSISLDQDPDSATYFMANDIKELANDSLAIVSTISSPFSGQFHNYNIAVIVLKPDGTLIWSNNYAISNVKAEGMAIHESADKELYVTGSVHPASGLKQLIVMKLSDLGNRLWSFGYGINATTEGAGYAITSRTSATATEEFYVAGYINAPSLARGKDIHVIAVDESGNLLSSHAHGTAGDEEARWLTMVPKTVGLLDSLFLTGNTNGVGAGFEDAFVMETLGSSSVQNFTTHGGARGDFGREIKVQGSKAYTVGDFLELYPFGNSARKGLLLSSDTGPPPARPICGASHALDTKSLTIYSNVAKFTTYALPMKMRTVSALTLSTAATSAICDALPN